LKSQFADKTVNRTTEVEISRGPYPAFNRPRSGLRFIARANPAINRWAIFTSSATRTKTSL